MFNNELWISKPPLAPPVPTLLVPRRFGFAAKASWSAALQLRRHGHRSHELKADQGEAGPRNLGIGYASKFIIVAC